MLDVVTDWVGVATIVCISCDWRSTAADQADARIYAREFASSICVLDVCMPILNKKLPEVISVIISVAIYTLRH
jgi:hypothetical protein